MFQLPFFVTDLDTVDDSDCDDGSSFDTCEEFDPNDEWHMWDIPMSCFTLWAKRSNQVPSTTSFIAFAANFMPYLNDDDDIHRTAFLASIRSRPPTPHPFSSLRYLKLSIQLLQCLEIPLIFLTNLFPKLEHLVLQYDGCLVVVPSLLFVLRRSVSGCVSSYISRLTPRDLLSH